MPEISTGHHHKAFVPGQSADDTSRSGRAEAVLKNRTRSLED